jgi:hypothetical protein
MAQVQQSCPDVGYAVTSSSLQILPVQLGNSAILCNVSSGRAGPVVPKYHKRSVFTATVEKPAQSCWPPRGLSARFALKGMAKDITLQCQDCQQCTRSMVPGHGQMAIVPVQVPSRRFSHLHRDLVGPLPTYTEEFFSYFHRRRQEYPLGGGHTCARDFSSLCRSHLHGLSSKIRGPFNHYIGKGSTILLF